jgi:hypothetical protein
MRRCATAVLVAGLVALAVAPSAAQKAPPARQPMALNPPGAPAGPLKIAPSKPVVAPGINAQGDSGATPGGARSANARTVSVSARQAAEQTIAALVAAMKNMPKRPPAPPEPRTARARRGDAAAGGQGLDGPTPITYHVTWPATEPEPGVGRRVELDWPGKSTGGPVQLHWND